MNTIKNLITNKSHLIIYWVFCIYFQQFVTQLLLPSTIRFVIWHILWVLDIAWVMTILIYDIYKKNICFKDPKILILIIFVLFTTISWLLKQPDHGPYYIFTLVTLYEQVFIFYTYAKENSIDDIKCLFKKLATIFIYFVSFYSFVSLVCYVTNYTSFTLPNGTEINVLVSIGSLGHKTERLIGLWTNTSVAGFDCYLAVILSLYLINQNNNNIQNSVFIIFNSIMLYFTNSRIALFLLLFTFLCFILFQITKKFGLAKTIRLSFEFITLISIIYIIYILYSYPDLITNLKANSATIIDNWTSGRLDMTIQTLSYTKNCLFLGSGYCNSEFTVAAYKLIHPHNIFLALLLYTGIPGLVLFTIFLILNVKDIVHNLDYIKLNNLKWLVVLVICVFFESLLDIAIIGAPINIQTLYFYLCLGILVKDTNKKI